MATGKPGLRWRSRRNGHARTRLSHAEPKWDLLAFTGGPVGCVDWCPRRFGGTAFVAVGANPPRVAKTRGGVLLSGPCAIQVSPI